MHVIVGIDLHQVGIGFLYNDRLRRAVLFLTIVFIEIQFKGGPES